MIIGIDGNEANIENRVGVNQYAYQLLVNLKKLQDKEKTKHEFVIFLKNKPLSDLPHESDSWKYMVLRGKGLWVITRLTPYLLRNKGNIDLFFSPSHYLPPFSRIPMVCSIMDLGYLEFSDQFKKRDFWQLKYWTARSICVAKKVVAISHATKNDIVRHYNCARNKVEVVYLGYNSDVYNNNIDVNDVRRIKNKYAMGQDYLLFLSTLKPNKNIEGLIQSFGLISKKHKNLKLIIAGKKGWLYESIFDLVKKSKLEEKIVFTGFVAEKEKPALIKGAKIFVLPSFWEGFGLDVLSAMACGVPVVVSNRGSLPEVVGKAGKIINPDNIDELSNSMDEILNMSKKAYNKLIKTGYSQATKFSWEKTATETLKIFDKFE